MRILQVINRFDFGGAENHIRELCNEQVAMDHQVILVARNGRQRPLLDKRVQFCEVPKWMGKLMLVNAMLVAFLALKYKVSVIHAHQRLPILSACLAGTLLHIPVVVTVHGRVKYDIRSFLSRKLSTRIICVSRQSLTVASCYETIKHKSVVIPNGIPIPKKAPVLEPYTIGYISRMDDRHSEVIRHLIEAVEQLKSEYPQLKLKLMGDGKGATKLKPIVEAANLRMNSDTIQFKGFINNLEQSNTYPELILGVGRVAIEALARHSNLISVNCKRTGALITPENFEEYAINNFVNVHGIPPTTETLYQHVKTYLTNRDAHRTMATTVSSRVINEFNIRRTTTDIVSLYSSLGV